MKNKTIAAVLALFLGGLGIHKFYLGKPIWGLVYLIFCWTFIPAIIALFESIGLMLMTDEKFQKQYGASYVQCPDCREMVLRDARVCKHCGFRFSTSEAA